MSMEDIFHTAVKTMAPGYAAMSFVPLKWRYYNPLHPGIYQVLQGIPKVRVLKV